MSLSWTRHGEWFLAPGFVETADGRRVDCAEGEDSGWRPALDLLDAELRSTGRGRATVVLSNHFVRYLVVPWRPDLRSAAERQGFARHLFAEAFGGERAEDWDIRVAPEPGGAPRLASAVDSGLIGAVRERSGQAKVRLTSVQPLLMNAFNAHRRHPGVANAWFGVCEPGRLCLALLSGGAWRTVANVRTDGDPASELRALLPLARARAAALGAESDLVFVCSRGGPDVRSIQLPGFRVEALDADGSESKHVNHRSVETAA